MESISYFQTAHEMAKAEAIKGIDQEPRLLSHGLFLTCRHDQRTDICIARARRRIPSGI